MALYTDAVKMLTSLLLQIWLMPVTTTSLEEPGAWSMHAPYLHVSATSLTKGQRLHVSCNLTYPASFTASVYIGLEHRPLRRQQYHEVGEVPVEEQTDDHWVVISASYDVRRAAPRHVGHYRCWAWNSRDDLVLNSPEAGVTVKVLSRRRPRLRVTPKRLAEGGLLHAQCNSTTRGSEFLVLGLEYKPVGAQVYQQLVDSQVFEASPADAARSPRTTVTRDVQLEVSRQHGGLYRCWVLRAQHSVRAVSRVVRVVGKPQLTVSKQLVRLGERFSVTCKMDSPSDSHYLNVQHRLFNDTEFSDVADQNSEETQLDEKTYRQTVKLNIRAAVEEDGGQYRCLAAHHHQELGDSGARSVHVIGDSPLILLDNKGPLLLTKGSSSNITCVGVDAIEWIHVLNGQVQDDRSGARGLQHSYVTSGPLENTSAAKKRQSFYRRVLHLHNVTCSEAGSYVCRTTVHSNDTATWDGRAVEPGRTASGKDEADVTRSGGSLPAFNADVMDVYVSDSDQLLINSSDQQTPQAVLLVRHNHPVLLQCVKCRPDASIRLVRIGAASAGLASQNNGTLVDFVYHDPRRGYTLRGVTGSVACEARLDGSLPAQLLVFRLQADDTGLPESLTSVYIVIIACCLLFLIGTAVLIAGCKLLRWKRSLRMEHENLEKFLIQSQGEYNPELPIDEQMGCVPYNTTWEFPEERLHMGMILGQGAFGRVVKAEAVGIGNSPGAVTVAVKVIKDCTSKEQMMALVSELKILIHVGQHLNIVNLLGAVTKDLRYGKLSIIVEYCQFGSLQNYLLKNKDTFRDTVEVKKADVKAKSEKARRNGMASRGAACRKYVNQEAQPDGPPLTITNLLIWAFQVSRGMEYLAAKKYIHRDMAARNVLLARNNVVKICDFGLARDCYRDAKYYKKRDGPVPIKWMALESLTHRLYTTKSDVWSFGIFLWELFSLGGNPYPGVDAATSDFIALLESGYRMDKPKLASHEVYAVMRRTWEADPLMRPSFTDLVAVMSSFLEARARQNYLNLSPSGPDLDLGGKDGYLRMSSTSEYVPMSPTTCRPPPLDAAAENDKASKMERYVNMGEPAKNRLAGSAQDGNSLRRLRSFTRDDVISEDFPDACSRKNGFHYVQPRSPEDSKLLGHSEGMAADFGVNACVISADQGTDMAGYKKSDLTRSLLDSGVGLPPDSDQPLTIDEGDKGHVVFFQNRRTRRFSGAEGRDKGLWNASGDDHEDDDEGDDPNDETEDRDDDCVFLPDTARMPDGTARPSGGEGPMDIHPPGPALHKMTLSFRGSLDSGRFSTGSPLTSSTMSSPDLLSISPAYPCL